MRHNSVFFSPVWLRLRLDLPHIRGNWEYVFLLPHLAHPCPSLCHARTNLGRRPDCMSPHAHRLQCVNSTDHPLMCLFMIPLTEQVAWISHTDPLGPVDLSDTVRSGKMRSFFFWEAADTFLRQPAGVMVSFQNVVPRD